MHVSHLACLTTKNDSENAVLAGRKALMKFTLPFLCIYYEQSKFWIYLEFGEFL